MVRCKGVSFAVRVTVSGGTSNPLLVGIPEPCVSAPMRRLDKSP